MKTLLAVLALLAPLTTVAPTDEPLALTDDLVGTWQVDLRPTPDAEPYYQELIISSVADGALAGVFYGSAVQFGRVSLGQDGVVFAFVTMDRSSRYVTTGRLVDGRLEGVTYSPDRDLLQSWQAERSGE
ncbi:MAG: hypothetical protein AAGI91_04130 [Bacteroidota bacterium]